jgi:hypothetical protein
VKFVAKRRVRPPVPVHSSPVRRWAPQGIAGVCSWGRERCAHFNPLLDNPYQPAKAGPTALLIELNVRRSDQGRVDGDFSSHQRVEIGRLHIHRVNTKLSQFILQAGAR